MMMKFSYSPALLALGMAAATAPAWSQVAPGGTVAGNAPVAAAAVARTVYLWDSGGTGSAKQDTWGNGAVATATDVTHDGASTLKLTTRNFGEGVRFDLKSPVELAPYRTNGFLRFRLRFREAEVQTPDTPGAMDGPGVDGPRRPGMGRPGMGRPGGGPPGTGRGGRPSRRDDLLIAPPAHAGPTTGARPQIQPLPPLGGPPRPGAGGFGGEDIPGLEDGNDIFIPVGPPPQKTPITTLQMTLVLDKGVLSGRLNIDLDKVKANETGWRFFVLPLKAMRATPDAGGSIQRLIVTSDQEDSFYLAQAALVIETGTMLVTIRRPSDPPGVQPAEITVKPGLLTLIADIEAGAADPEVEWNFDADNVGNLPPAPNQVEAGAGVGVGGEEGDEAPRVPGGRPGGRPGADDGGAGGEGGEAPVIVGPRIDARGLVARFEYPNEEQNYRVEARVRDRTGKKPDVVVSLMVSVRA
ncbi:MAG TPA: hypothetical protein VNA16_06855 [Abditibacteriaceae bacterium]|nr:hypothetical protein [Abditibacteriaceae bacterium]